MSTLTLKPRARASAPTSYGLPQVNLLPPEVSAARALRHVKQWLAVSLLIVLAVLVAGYAFAALSLKAANDDFTDAQAESVTLKSQEKQYADVLPVLSGIQRTKDARTLVMGPEVLWRPYLDAVAAVLPEHASVRTFSVSTAASAAAAPALSSLTPNGVANITFTARVSTLPDSAAWIDALNSVPGFYGTSTSTDQLGEENGVVFYTVSTIVQVDASTFANRFPAAADAAADTDGN